MLEKALQLLKELLSAAQVEECPDPDCKICRKKQETICKVKEFLNEIQASK